MDQVFHHDRQSHPDKIRSSCHRLPVLPHHHRRGSRRVDSRRRIDPVVRGHVRVNLADHGLLLGHGPARHAGPRVGVHVVAGDVIGIQQAHRLSVGEELVGMRHAQTKPHQPVPQVRARHAREGERRLTVHRNSRRRLDVDGEQKLLSPCSRPAALLQGVDIGGQHFLERRRLLARGIHQRLQRMLLRADGNEEKQQQRGQVFH